MLSRSCQTLWTRSHILICRFKLLANLVGGRCPATVAATVPAAPAKPSVRVVEERDFLTGGVSGVVPRDVTDGCFDAAPAADAGDQAGAEGPGGDDFVAIDGPPEYPESDVDVEMMSAERLAQDAVSVRHLLTLLRHLNAQRVTGRKRC